MPSRRSISPIEMTDLHSSPRFQRTISMATSVKSTSTERRQSPAPESPASRRSHHWTARDNSPAGSVDRYSGVSPATDFNRKRSDSPPATDSPTSIRSHVPTRKASPATASQSPASSSNSCLSLRVNPLTQSRSPPRLKAQWACDVQLCPSYGTARPSRAELERHMAYHQAPSVQHPRKGTVFKCFRCPFWSAGNTLPQHVSIAGAYFHRPLQLHHLYRRKAMETNGQRNMAIHHLQQAGQSQNNCAGNDGVRHRHRRTVESPRPSKIARPLQARLRQSHPSEVNGNVRRVTVQHPRLQISEDVR